MCTSPILIKNRKYRSLYVKIPTSYISVPCGQCDECLRKRAKDLFVRAKYESEACFLNGGCGFMCTLTYDDMHLPYIMHLGKKYLVFNKKHVQDFIKRLRTNLDRYFLKSYETIAPDFKYLVTSEYGTNPFCSHRPHYHLIFLFNVSVSLAAFRRAFTQSLVNRRDNKRIFGKIFQCDILNIKKGGILYSCKYILKDMTYGIQNGIIKDKIKFYTHYVNSKHGIRELAESSEDYFFNKAIRSTKAYKKDIATYVGKYRNMLQFYLVSNDFGCSAICRRYGENLFTLGVLNIDGFVYSIPKQVIQRLERSAGSDRRDSISKAVFISQFEKSINESVRDKFITANQGSQLLDFAKNFLQPRFGSLYFVSPSGVSYWNLISKSPLRDYDELFNEMGFYDDNDFFTLRDKVYKVINHCNAPEKLKFRAALAKRKSDKEREDYVIKKRNKS